MSSCHAAPATPGHAPEYEQPRAGNANRRSGDLRRDPSDTSTASPAEHRIKLHGQWAMRDRQASTTASPSVAAHTKTKRDHPPEPPTQTQTETPRSNKGRRCTRHTGLLKSNWPEDLPRHGRPIHDLPRSVTISHDMVGPSIDSSRPRSLLGLERGDNLLVVLDALRPHCLHQRGGRLGGCRHRCSQCSRSRRPQAPHQTQPWALARSLAARMKAINEMGISCAPF